MEILQKTKQWRWYVWDIEVTDGSEFQVYG